ncbi:hypothetical protein GE21DRAFT_8752 [Neurospora crassa]|uniref:Uncharacterized protein n=1 Tax=Neurospora crassa (strain ATCC 24698 / 74-OR23-1A / CBS 708.71 / DSM 1257 / FGSC 987) TaxID=367110 RepID=V5IN12_NEUCR|nr:hypothetical protein NCU12085 [Neurospora crassa OR74A]ESA42136.1 hypothetical protein NCU12085 [Neurospora crassa OR74A]KHE88976.1 hypothetical protein GE21DRAFT_8752 [Neurospora crassa]|eukprot:XP_011395041.1 hypothetical protein NCU12085 [Neurospora crassa OR74A]
MRDMEPMFLFPFFILTLIFLAPLLCCKIAIIKPMILSLLCHLKTVTMTGSSTLVLLSLFSLGFTPSSSLGFLSHMNSSLAVALSTIFLILTSSHRVFTRLQSGTTTLTPKSSRSLTSTDNINNITTADNITFTTSNIQRFQS